MKYKLLTTGAMIALMLSPTNAHANPCISADIWLANTEALTPGNLGGSVGVCYDFGPVRIAGVVARHRHLNRNVDNLYASAYLEPWAFWGVTPNIGLSIGFGSVFALKPSMGISYPLTDSLLITIGMDKICYDVRCRSRDTVITTGFRKEF